MKKILYTVALTGALMATSVSCNEFDELITTDPNRTTDVAPEVLLTNAMRTMNGVVSSAVGALYAQHMSETQYTTASRYETVNFDFNGFYTGALNNLQHIIDLNSNAETAQNALASGSNANQIAVARILKAFFYHHMTDRWGDLPYSEALQGKEDFKPAYDTQEAIYTAMMSELKAAVGQIDGGNGVNGDILFDGNMDMWKKFANTLRMVIALRMSNADASTAQSEFVAAVQAGVISSNAENMMYPYLNEAANENPWFTRFITRTDYALSSTVVDMIKPWGDPRLNSWGDPAPSTGEIEGMPYGIDDAGDIPNDDVSFPNSTYVRAQAAPLPIFTYSQVLFSMAEAAERGWISESSSQLYYDGIQASMEQWSAFDQNVFDTYIAQDGVAWDQSKAMELIGIQKWLGLFLQGYEAWNEWKRTGYPALVPARDAINTGGQIPRRQGYPTSERDLNSDNYNAVVSSQGPDELSTRMWWDQ